MLKISSETIAFWILLMIAESWKCAATQEKCVLFLKHS